MTPPGSKPVLDTAHAVSATDLIKRIERLEQQLQLRDREHAAAVDQHKAVVAEQAEAIAQRDVTIAELKAYIFGRKTERRSDPGQLTLFDLGEPAPEAPLDLPPQPAKPRRRRTSHARKPFPENLLRNVIPVDPPADERVCECCGKDMVRIGEDVVERLEIVPQRFFVNRYVAGRWACPNRDSQVKQAPIPAGLVDRSRYEASVYALVVASKYLLHLPLHRLEADFRGRGVEMNRSTMWGLVERVGELMAPVVDQMEREILSCSYLQMDDSFLTVTTPGKKGSKRGHIWVIRNGAKAMYRFSLKRNREVPKDLLAGWKGGFLQADGHDSFDVVAAAPGVVRVGCWAHARRLWIKAEKVDRQPAQRFIQLIGRAFRVERILKERRRRDDLDDRAFYALRHEVRAHVTARIIDGIERLRHSQVTGPNPPLPKGPTGRALTYLASQGTPLRNVLESGVVELDNNASERDLRHAVVGRKNWQMTSEDRGAISMARLFSIIVSCKAAGIHAEAYLRDVLPRLSTTPASAIAELTPWAWAAAAAPSSASS